MEQSWNYEKIQNHASSSTSIARQRRPTSGPDRSEWKDVGKVREMVNPLVVGFGLGFAIAWLLSLQRLQQRQFHFPLHFLVVGDWGRNGFYNQSVVASQMGQVGTMLGISFVISTGDNFYNTGLAGVDDIQFTTSFTNIYTSPSLQTRWYAVLGNHDYMGDVLSQMDPYIQLRDDRWICQREYHLQYSLCTDSMKGCKMHVDFFFIDTTPFVDDYWAASQTHTFDWRGLASREEQLRNQLQSLNDKLETSTANWKVVVGHHTIRSMGYHGDTPELVKNLLPILKKHRVDLYVNGHDHTLQHIKDQDSGVHFVTSGGGSKAWDGVRSSENTEGVLFAYDGQGFAAISMGPHELLLSFHDGLGNTIYTAHLHKSRH
ncbi:tartrate-resistant acid phosphatase type 5 [Marchantia polymorpha subsp. ruderalis]|uniref:Purple acid phosphatase n=2 Tax=Marchantia polymorpha TaxID=3197 RepID=A0AAF6B7H7_MARPO|nr:hypothetical protein MARPO_0115s0017 [Marchantia polymorpha]BBN07961.1 hypothetical protein Mp_4g07640 [Marchantia polymorpha subsp. ruderalis]|eukprot:PTQ31093.1 hypothetical protein MARPO_0115s0017 [Marchantia polymorpha]